MSWRDQLPQLSGGPFITDGGMETTLIFHEGLDLPCFASFDLLKDAQGTDPLGDGYSPGRLMASAEAERYHAEQISTFANTAADLVSAWTMTYVEEAVGIVRGARNAGMPVMVSFTVETDGRLPSGTALKDAIERVDAETEGGAAEICRAWFEQTSAS